MTKSNRVASDRSDIGARLMLLLLCCLWGVTWPIMRLALYQIPPLSMRTTSVALGALTLYLVCLIKGRSFRLHNAKTVAHVVVASLLNVTSFSLFGSFAQLTAATSRVAILAYTMPIWSVVMAWLFLGERPSRLEAFSVGLCATGLTILIYPLTAAGVPIGILLALATGVSWAAGTVYVKWARIDADPMGVASWQVTIAFLTLVPCLLVSEGGLHLGSADARALAATAFTGIFASGIAYGLWFAIIQRLPAMTASLGVLGSPVIGIFASMAILGERPTVADFVGFALIFGASACVLLAHRAPAEPTP